MLKIAAPVIENLADGKLIERLPLADRPERGDVTHLEALGRTLEGIAPWLEADLPEGEEKELQAKYRTLTIKALDMATDPASPDFLNFCQGKQPLVDAAFLAHGILRAKKQLWENLPDRVKVNLKNALISSRCIEPFYNNWLLFASMVEAALYYMGEEIIEERLDKGIDVLTESFQREGKVKQIACVIVFLANCCRKIRACFIMQAFGLSNQPQ